MSYGERTFNPIEHDETPDTSEDRILCGCGDARCWLDPDDATNVYIKDTWYAADCVGLCYFCGQVDDLRNLIRVSGSWLSHEGCAAKHPVISDEQYRALHADEQRDDMERVRR